MFIGPEAKRASLGAFVTLLLKRLGIWLQASKFQELWYAKEIVPPVKQRRLGGSVVTRGMTSRGGINHSSSSISYPNHPYCHNAPPLILSQTLHPFSYTTTQQEELRAILIPSKPRLSRVEIE